MKTVGRWPWRLESAKKRVITYLSNLRLPKMDGANLQYEALNTLSVVDWQHLCEEVYENRGKTLKKDHLQQSHTEMEK